MTVRDPHGRLAVGLAASLSLMLLAALLTLVASPSGAQEGADGEGIATSASLSAEYLQASETAYVARVDDYADALASVPLVSRAQAPLLFVDGDEVSQEVLDELTRLGVQEVVILGGTAAVSQAVEDQLNDADYTTRRIAGDTRFETALLVAQEFNPGMGDTAYIVEGEHADPTRGWPDAINAGAIAGATGSIILPVNAERLPMEIADYLSANGLSPVIVGGPAAVTEATAGAIGAAVTEEGGDPVEVPRIAGDTRFTTSVAAYDTGISELGLSPAQRFVIPGCSFVEGLAASNIAAQLGVGTVMVDCENPDSSPESIALLGTSLDLVTDTIPVGSQFSQAVLDAIQAAANPEAPQAAFCLRLLHHNDGESDLFPDDAGYGGLASLVTLAGDLQNTPFPPSCEDSGVVTVTSGDNFLAGANLQASFERADDEPVYDALGLSLVDYDALALGNHDFDFNPDFTARFISSFQGDSPPPFLSANLDVSAEPALDALADAGRIAPSVVVDKGETQVGIIGLTTPALRTISSPRNVEVMQEIVDITQAQVDLLTQAGVDKIVLISHLQGLGGDDGDLEFISQIDGVDAVVAGGGDEVLADPGDPLVPDDRESIFDSYPIVVEDNSGTEVPVVTTSGGYNYLGRLDLRFDSAGNLLDQTPFIDSTSRMVRVADPSIPGGVAPDEQVVEEVYEPVQAFVADLDTTVIAQSEVRLNGDRPDIRVSEQNSGNLVADSQRWFGENFGEQFGLDPNATFVGVQNGGGIRHDGTDIGPGDITVLDTFDMVPFPNFVAAFEDFTIPELKQLLERAYFDIEGVNGAFLHLSNLNVVVDLSQQAQEQDADGNIVTPGERVRTLTLGDGTPLITDGEVVANPPTVTMTMVDFSARGGDGYPLDDDFQVLGATYQQVLQDYITADVADGGLGGEITAAQYPEGGEGRITIEGGAG